MAVHLSERTSSVPAVTWVDVVGLRHQHRRNPLMALLTALSTSSAVFENGTRNVRMAWLLQASGHFMTSMMTAALPES